LIFAIASSIVAYVSIGRIGPKISSRMTAMVSFAPSTSVGSILREPADGDSLAGLSSITGGAARSRIVEQRGKTRAMTVVHDRGVVVVREVRRIESGCRALDALHERAFLPSGTSA
jgi:hypothetical protein